MRKLLGAFLLFIFTAIFATNDYQILERPYGFLKIYLDIPDELMEGQYNWSLMQLDVYDTNFRVNGGKIEHINRLFGRFIIDSTWAFQKGDSTDYIKFYPKLTSTNITNKIDTVFFMIYYPNFETIYTYLLFKQGDTIVKHFKPKLMQLR